MLDFHVLWEISIDIMIIFILYKMYILSLDLKPTDHRKLSAFLLFQKNVT